MIQICYKIIYTIELNKPLIKTKLFGYIGASRKLRVAFCIVSCGNKLGYIYKIKTRTKAPKD